MYVYRIQPKHYLVHQNCICTYVLHISRGFFYQQDFVSTPSDINMKIIVTNM